MKRALGFAVVALLLGSGLALSASGSDPRDPSAQPVAQAPDGQDGAAVPPAAEGGTASSVPSSSVPGRPPATAPASGSAFTGTSLPESTTPSTLAGGYDFRLVVTPTCARVGEELTVEVHLKVMGGVALMGSYADGHHHGTRHSGVSWDGKPVVYRWKAPSVPGEATLTAEAHDPETKTKGHKVVAFRVVAPEQVC